MSHPDRLRVAVIGHAFMGVAHSLAWDRLNTVYGLPAGIERAVLCGRDQKRVDAAARQLGWSESSTDWRSVISRDDIDVVDICTPVSSHADIAVAALDAGKHVVCEKPLALNSADAQRMAQAAAAAASAGRYAMVGFNYRRVPAVALLKQVLDDGGLGHPHQLRFSYHQDWGCDPKLPMSWRFRATEAGSGALADLGSHLIDLAAFLTGARIVATVGTTRTLIRTRPTAAGGVANVDVDDTVAFLATLDGGALASFDASRNVAGRKNALRVEIYGDVGTATFDLERPNELNLFQARDGSLTEGFRTVLVTEPDHPYLAAWWPPGHVLGWEHSFVHELHDFVVAVSEGKQPEPGFAQGLYVQRVIETVLRSDRGWTPVPIDERA